MAKTDLIILGMIYLIPSHGYQLKKNIKETFGNPYFKLNNNALYPTLARLEQKGLIEGKETHGEKMNKKVYNITENGKKELIKMVSTPMKPDTDEFSIKVQFVFFDMVPKENRLKVIEPLYEAKLKEHQEALKKKEKFSSNMTPITLTVLEYGIKEIENSLDFYKKLMEME